MTRGATRLASSTRITITTSSSTSVKPASPRAVARSFPEAATRRRMRVNKVIMSPPSVLFAFPIVAPPQIARSLMLMTAPRIEMMIPAMKTLTSRMMTGSKIVNVLCTAVSSFSSNMSAM